MSLKLSTRGLSSLGQASDTGSPAEQRDDAKKNLFKVMRPLPTQHFWKVYFDRYVDPLFMIILKPTILVPSRKLLNPVQRRKH